MTTITFQKCDLSGGDRRIWWGQVLAVDLKFEKIRELDYGLEEFQPIGVDRYAINGLDGSVWGGYGLSMDNDRDKTIYILRDEDCIMEYETASTLDYRPETIKADHTNGNIYLAGQNGSTPSQILLLAFFNGADPKSCPRKVSSYMVGTQTDDYELVQFDIDTM